MKKKLLSVLLAGALVSSVVAAGAVAVSAEEDSGLAPGSYCNNGAYTPSAGVETKHLMFAMPGAWQNDTWKADPNGASAGLYWWTGYDTPDNKFGHGWPGYQAQKVTEGSIDNLYAMDVPTYGNGEQGNGMQIIWNNYLDGGTETDPVKNPFREAAQQSKDTPGQYYARADVYPSYYEPLFKYAYVENFKKIGVPGVEALDMNAADFWEQLNKLAAAYLGEDWDSLGSSEKTYQVDNVIDEAELDFSMFGSYAGNFFNEDLVGEDDCYPNEESNGFGMAFTFDNMVYVVDFDVSKMTLSPLSQKLGMGGDFFFYYGNGEYGSWPTKELNEQMKEVFGDAVKSGNFTEGEYLTKTMEELMKEYEDLHKDDPTEPAGSTTATAGTASTDATSSSSNSSSGSATNTSNSAIATGQASLISFALLVLVAAIGIVVFTRKKSQK